MALLLSANQTGQKGSGSEKRVDAISRGDVLLDLRPESQLFHPKNRRFEPHVVPGKLLDYGSRQIKSGSPVWAE